MPVTIAAACQGLIVDNVKAILFLQALVFEHGRFWNVVEPCSLFCLQTGSTLNDVDDS
jgi:hypothetical protein